MLSIFAGVVTGDLQGCHVSGKNKIFSKSGKGQRILKKMSGNFGYLTHVGELFGNFVMSYQEILS